MGRAFRRSPPFLTVQRYRHGILYTPRRFDIVSLDPPPPPPPRLFIPDTGRNLDERNSGSVWKKREGGGDASRREATRRF